MNPQNKETRAAANDSSSGDVVDAKHSIIMYSYIFVRNTVDPFENKDSSHHRGTWWSRQV